MITKRLSANISFLVLAFITIIASVQPQTPVEKIDAMLSRLVATTSPSDYLLNALAIQGAYAEVYLARWQADHDGKFDEHEAQANKLTERIRAKEDELLLKPLEYESMRLSLNEYNAERPLRKRFNAISKADKFSFLPYYQLLLTAEFYRDHVYTEAHSRDFVIFLEDFIGEVDWKHNEKREAADYFISQVKSILGKPSTPINERDEVSLLKNLDEHIDNNVGALAKLKVLKKIGIALLSNKKQDEIKDRIKDHKKNILKLKSFVRKNSKMFFRAGMGEPVRKLKKDAEQETQVAQGTPLEDIVRNLSFAPAAAEVEFYLNALPDPTINEPEMRDYQDMMSQINGKKKYMLFKSSHLKTKDIPQPDTSGSESSDDSLGDFLDDSSHKTMLDKHWKTMIGAVVAIAILDHLNEKGLLEKGLRRLKGMFFGYRQITAEEEGHLVRELTEYATKLEPETYQLLEYERIKHLSPAVQKRIKTKVKYNTLMPNMPA